MKSGALSSGRIELPLIGIRKFSHSAKKNYCVPVVSDTVSSIADTASVLVEGADSKQMGRTYQVLRDFEK